MLSGADDIRAVSDYEGDYYSGCDARIFIGDLWVDDIITLQWTRSNAKNPRYSYSDPYFKAVSQGNVLIEGSFAIAFKETGYLPIVLERATRLGLIGGTTKDKHSTPIVGHYTRGDDVKSPVLEYRTVEKVLSDVANNRGSTDDFEAICETLEDRIWGTSGTKPIPKPDEYDIRSRSVRGGVEYTFPGKGFDIVIVYGDYSVGYSNHTIKAINDVHINGSSQTIVVNGEPVAEMYNFFARTTDENVGQNSQFFDNMGRVLDTANDVAGTAGDKLPTQYLIPGILVYVKSGPFKGITAEILDEAHTYLKDRHTNNYESIVATGGGVIQVSSDTSVSIPPGGADYIVKPYGKDLNSMARIEGTDEATMPGYQTPSHAYIPQQFGVKVSDIMVLNRTGDNSNWEALTRGLPRGSRFAIVQ